MLGDGVALLRIFNRDRLFSSATAQDTISIFQDSAETNLPVRFAPMTDSQNKGCVLNDGINNSVVADSKSPQTCEFPCEGWEAVRLIRQMFFDSGENPFCLNFVYLPEVARYRLLECDLIAQALSSYHLS